MSKIIPEVLESSESSALVDPESIVPEVIAACRTKIEGNEHAAALELIDRVYSSINAIDRIPLTGLKADCFQSLGDFDAAIASYQSILEIQSETPYWVHVGYANLLERKGKNDEAIEHMCFALKKEFSMELVERAVASSQFTTTPRAAHKKIADISLAQESYDLVTKVGEFLISEGITAEGIRIFEEVILPDCSDRVAVIEKMVMACKLSGESKAACAKIESWKSEHPNDNRLDTLHIFCLESRILDSEQGMPCFAVANDQVLNEFEVRINGRRVRNGLERYGRILARSADEADNSGMRRYLLLMPACYVDSNKDSYLLTIDELSNKKRTYSGNYPTKKLLENDRDLYPGDFEYLGDNRIHGWYVSKIDKVSKLAVYVNDNHLQNIDVNLERPDVAEVTGNGSLYSGFDFSWSSEISVEKIELRNTITGLPVLGTPIKIQRLENAVKQLESTIANSNGGQNNNINPESLEKIFRTLRKQPKISIEHTITNKNLVRNYQEGLSVVVPVFNGLEDVKRCIASILHTTTKIAHEIVCVNDSSTDKEVSPYLQDLESSNDNVTLIHSDINRGFVKTVNKGLAARTYKDVVILNSDTIVPQSFIDRIYNAGTIDSRYGVITPLSNNATIFSFPLHLVENRLKDFEELNEIDKFLRDNAGEELLEVPTGHGYCMFVKGEVLETVGLLNEDEWGVGYGEENDYCQKVKMHGWKVAAYYGMYVGHVGSVSFGDKKRDSQISKNLKRLNKLYPEYDNLIQQYIHDEGDSRIIRNRLQLLRFQQGVQTDDVLFVTHGLGGGTKEYINRCVASLAEEGIRSVFLSTELDRIVICDPDKTLYCEYRIDEIEVLREHFQILQLKDVILNSTFNFPSELFDKISEISGKYTVVLHDYSWICPRINLIDASGSYCGMPSSEVCVRCIEVGGTHESFIPKWNNVNSGFDLWLTKNKTLLQNARKVIAPSQDTAKRMRSKYPDLEVLVKYHEDNFTLAENVVRYKAASIEQHVIGIFGMIGDHKGMQELKQLCWLLTTRYPGIQIVFFGAMSEQNWMKGYNNVRCVGEYKNDTLSDLICRVKPTLGLFLSKWPETYCYTISDAISNGVYPVALDIGAFQERMEIHNYGATIPFTADVEKLCDSILGVIDTEEFKNCSTSDIKTGANYKTFSREYFEISLERKE